MERKLVLSNGMEFIGKGFGSMQETIAHLVFNTSMVGYQEIISNPVNYDSMVVMTYPLIGNYGIMDEDYDSKIISVKALIVREYNDKPSNFRYTRTLNEVLEENDVVGLTHIDTRALTTVLREQGNMMGIICDSTVSTQTALDKINAYQNLDNPTEKVSCKKKWYSRCANPKYNIVTIDLGVSYSIVKAMNAIGMNVTIVPFNTSFEKIEELRPDGIFISDGPFNIDHNDSVIELIQKCLGKYPIYAVGLGHLLLAKANNNPVSLLKCGYHGGNHPVKCLSTNSIDMATVNMQAVVESLNQGTQTHESMINHAIMGINYEASHAFSTSYQPDLYACPRDFNHLFDLFISNIEQMKGVC